ncbi:hypothetical protein [Vibrio parahaemolyticus]|nr:hypothetical protein [Vibrio parahaemolyticus]
MESTVQGINPSDGEVDRGLITFIAITDELMRVYLSVEGLMFFL